MGYDNRQPRFQALFDEHFRDVLAYAMRRTPEPADAADAAAEVFLTAWRRIDRVPEGAEARLWLFGVARNTLRNTTRGRRRRYALAGRLREQLAAHVPSHDETSDTAVVVRRALSLLAPDDAEVLRLSAWEGLEPGEIAVVLGIAPATARGRLHRARGRLRTRLTQMGVGADDASATVTPTPRLIQETP